MGTLVTDMTHFCTQEPSYGLSAFFDLIANLASKLKASWRAMTLNITIRPARTCRPRLNMCFLLTHRDVAIVSEGTPSEEAFNMIKSKKEDNVVVCDASGEFVSASYWLSLGAGSC